LKLSALSSLDFRIFRNQDSESPQKKNPRAQLEGFLNGGP